MQLHELSLCYVYSFLREEIGMVLREEFRLMVRKVRMMIREENRMILEIRMMLRQEIRIMR